MGKSFEEYRAEHLKEPFPLPMPDGTTVPIPLGSIDEQAAVGAAVAAASESGELTLFTGLEVLVGKEQAAKVAEAWGALPPEAWQAVMADMREHFGAGNSLASPPS